MDIAVGRINETECPKHKHRGKDKEGAGGDATPGSVQKPADVDRELRRFRAGQEHAKIQSVEKARLADPFFSLDQLCLHDRDLSGWSAETDEPEL